MGHHSHTEATEPGEDRSSITVSFYISVPRLSQLSLSGQILTYLLRVHFVPDIDFLKNSNQIQIIINYNSVE